MRAVNTRLLTYFVAAAQCGSFTEAAELCYTTQPNFSKQIAALEQELGVRLFFREHRAVRLTPAGQRYFERVQEIPERLKQAALEARELERTEHRSIRIGILEGHLLSAELMQQLSAFQRLHPEYQQTILRGDFEFLRNGLQSHELDIIFSLLFTLERERGIQTRILYAQLTFAAVNRQNPLSQRQRLEPEDLAQEDFVMLSEEISPASYDDLTALLDRIRHPQNRRHYVFSTEALFTSVEANQGIAFVDGHNRLKTSPYVRLIPVESSTKAPNFGAAWLKNTDKQAVYSFVSLFDSESTLNETLAAEAD